MRREHLHIPHPVEALLLADPLRTNESLAAEAGCDPSLINYYRRKHKLRKRDLLANRTITLSIEDRRWLAAEANRLGPDVTPTDVISALITDARNPDQ